MIKETYNPAFIINKPVVCICGSRSIDILNISRYIRSSSPGKNVSGGANGVDLIAEKWAKNHNIDFVAYLPNYKLFGKKAPLERDKDMVDFSDVVIAFWDGKSSGTAYTIRYAIRMNKKVFVHLIQNLD